MYQEYGYIFLGIYYHITKLSCQYIFSLAEQINSWVKNVNITSVLGYSFINSVVPLHLKSIQQWIHDITLQKKDSSILNSSKLDIYKKHLQN